MRILLTIHVEHNPNAGACGVILRLGDELRRNGHDVDIVTLSDLPAALPLGARQLLFPLFVAARLARRGRHYRVVDASSGDGWIGYSLVPRPKGQLRVTHSHGLEQRLAQVEREEAAAAGGPPLHTRLYRHGLRLWEVSRSFRAADVALVLNTADADWLKEREALPADRIACVRHGTPFADDPEAALSDGRLVCVQIGQYSARKGVDVTAAAMAPVMRRHPNVALRFIGAGVGADEVRRDYPAELHDRIEVIPRYGNVDLRRHLRGARIQLIPSRFEGNPVVKAEGIASGLVQVVSSDSGTAMDIEDGRNGLIIPVGNADALEQAVEGLVNDPRRLEALAAGALESSRLYRWSAVCAERLAIYELHLARRA